ncbi:MAG: hypothetical protein ACKO3R_03310 [bacterium]
MRYFSNALEDRRVYIRDSGINPYVNSYNTSSTELRKSLTTGGKTLTEATTVASNITNTNPADSFTKLGSSNSYELLSNVNGSNNDAITSDWTSAGAFKPIALTEFEARFGKVPVDANGNFNEEAMIAMASAGFNTEYGGSGDGASNFSVSNWMRLDHDGRMYWLGNMKAEYEAQKAAKFEEDMRLAMERDAERERNNNPVAQPQNNNTTAQIIGTIGQALIGMLA